MAKISSTPLLLFLSLPLLVHCDLVPGKMISFKSQPGQIYAGTTTTASDLETGLSDNPAEQVCANQCSLSSLCGAFYVQGEKCHEVSVADKSNTKADPTWPRQGPTYFVKSSTVDAPLFTTTTAAPENTTTITTTTVEGARPITSSTTTTTTTTTTTA